MYKWYLPTFSEVIALSEPDQAKWTGSLAQQRVRAERQWCGAIAALNQLLQQPDATSDSAIDSLTLEHSAEPIHGLVLSGPLPVLDQPDLMGKVSAWTFTVDSTYLNAWSPLQLLPAADQPAAADSSAMATLPLLANDPLAAEQFCLVLTAHFSLVMALGGTDHESAFVFSFTPEVVWQSWQALRSRLLLVNSPSLNQLDQLVKQFSPVAPDYQTVMQFSRLTLAHLPEPMEWAVKEISDAVQPAVVTLASHSAEAQPARSDTAIASWQDAVARRKSSTPQRPEGSANHAAPSADDLHVAQPSADTELLQAIAHEVRTPLTTIRTLTRLLMKRKDLNPDIHKRLAVIDRECTEQIDRFNLIFKAVELETSAVKRPLMPLAPISLAQVFQQNLTRWQEQAAQHNLTLEVILPQKLPLVVADPTMLDQVLTGLVDRITHSLPSGSHIQVHVALAGHQLKLQFQSYPQLPESSSDGSKSSCNGKSSFKPPLKSLGQLLMFQPETGNLSLNLAVTKNLFQALGGKMIVRQRPQQGEVLTVFLPLETRKLDE